jgi:hypothetical protein
MDLPPARVALLLIPLALAWLALAPQSRAICQDACLPTDNTAQGDGALVSLTTGFDNTAVGFETLNQNTTGFLNTAAGSSALHNNTVGNGNTATGAAALLFNTTGGGNTATGGDALEFNTRGNDNTANGVNALASNTTGDNNSATGYLALDTNNTGNNNTVIGSRALSRNTTGSDNIALGYKAGIHLTTGSDNIDIGNFGVAAEANTIRIGSVGTQTATFIAAISGATIPTGVPVIIDTNGHLGTTTSSARFKETIEPMDKASEAILALKPVTFHYKHQLDPSGIPQFGLVAEDVEKVNPDLVARDQQGKAYTVRYEAVNAMLLNEFLKEHHKVEQMQKQIDALTATVHKMSTQLELSKTAPQTVLNGQ